MDRQQHVELMRRIAVVVLTYNRAGELRRTLDKLLALPVSPAIVVVDNGSTDGTAQMMHSCFAKVRYIRQARNLGAAARNAGVLAVETPYVAFCDDDTWWAAGALERAVALLDAYPHVSVLCARVLVGIEEREDPTCTAMAKSPLPCEQLPGPALLGFLAGASVMRRDAFLEAGGYEPRLFIGGEEGLLALDMAAGGWKMAYVPELIVHHHPSSLRDSSTRNKHLARNALWVCWMRLPYGAALRQSWRILREASRSGILKPVLAEALSGIPWALKHRRRVPPQVARWHQWLHG
ncbi:glycosyltransferase [Comamonas sp. w2-DMI]|uniref:glycosyltransferase family 2 protein n=1 Tax=Comamonas sp. w2-DMI TaxID=3126391 RepID=UPI0032E3B3B1